MNLSVIYEDKDALAVNKPSGISVHPDGKSNTPTLTDFIAQKYPHIEKVGEPLMLSSGKIIHRAGIVHRLDKETSGVVLFAKNQNAFLFFKKQFQERNVEKEYRAIVYGAPKEKEGVIDKPIGRSAKDFRARSVHASARGAKRPAQTRYSVLVRGAEYAYLSVFPKTGRTHQIRVHLQSIGHPVLCDKLYAPRRACSKEMGRLALHAFSLSVRLPAGSVILLEAPLPDDFTQALTSLRLNK